MPDPGSANPTAMDSPLDVDATNTPYRELPSVSELARLARTEPSPLSEAMATRLAQRFLAEERDRIGAGHRPHREAVVAAFQEAVARLHRPRLRPLLNATGVVIHTNLGRAPVSPAAASAMASAAASTVALELDPETNQRGGRMREISGLMRLLTGAESTLVVNNGAAAVLLTVAAVAAGRRVIVSRGEAVEIGGGFRIPEVIQQSGAALVEVGTTNRTYVTDYARATDEQTAAYLKVHPSNFAIEGFVHRTATSDLAVLGRERGVPVIEDLGSGALLDTTLFGLAREPTLMASIGAGATVVIASGDKLLGGPQAGIVCGEVAWIERISRHPLARAVRADKTCIAGLAATLRHYVRGEATEVIPVWRMIATPSNAVRVRAERVREELARSGIESSLAEVRSSIGGGSLPGQELPSWAVALTERVDDLGHRLRTGEPAVFGRIEHGKLLLDLRTVLPEDDPILIHAVQTGVRHQAGGQ
jgi:L-seryl-tRNA(Ser) seleniumtransferase